MADRGREGDWSGGGRGDGKGRQGEREEAEEAEEGEEGEDGWRTHCGREGSSEGGREVGRGWGVGREVVGLLS